MIDWKKIDDWIDEANGDWENLEEPDGRFSGTELDIARRVSRAYHYGQHTGSCLAQSDF